MAVRTACIAEEQFHSTYLLTIKCVTLTFEISVEGAVMVAKFGAGERTDGIGDLDDRYVLRFFDMVECGDEKLAIFLDSAHTSGDDWPGLVNALLDRASNLVFARLACHFGVGGHRKERLCRKKRLQALGQEFLCRRIETVSVKVGDADAPVMEHELNFTGSQVPEPWSVAWNPPLYAVCSLSRCSVWTYAHTAFANTE